MSLTHWPLISKKLKHSVASNKGIYCKFISEKRKKLGYFVLIEITHSLVAEGQRTICTKCVKVSIPSAL